MQRYTPLKKKSTSDTAQCKDRIQALLRAYVSIRDGGCIFRGDVPNPNGYTIPTCNGYTISGVLILQGDHLITRANAATYADPRLAVCVCKGHHAWKSLGGNLRKRQYDEIVRLLIEPDRVALWEACERESHKPHRMYFSDWLKEEAYLKTKLRALENEHPAILELID